jgi:hypothetical protein
MVADIADQTLVVHQDASIASARKSRRQPA